MQQHFDAKAKQHLEGQISELLDKAEAAGADAAEAQIGHSQSMSVAVRGQQIDQLEHEHDQSASITVIRNQQVGTATTTDLTTKGLQSALEQAMTIARFTEADPYAGLADAKLMAKDWPDLATDHPWNLTAQQAAEIGCELERACLDYDERIKQSEGAHVMSSRTLSAYGNSHGFVGVELGTHHGLSVSAIAENVSGMQRDGASSQARDRHDLYDPQVIGQLAARRAVASLGAKTPPTTKAPVIFEPRVARSLWGHFLGAISGGTLYRNASFLKDRLGDKIMPDFVDLQQNPFLPKGLSSTGFDGDGVATQQRALIEKGVLQGYLLSTYSARRLGMKSTGNAGGVFNLQVSAGPASYEQLIEQMGTGLVVTQLMGQGVNLINGDYSRGAAGFWVENGRLAYPVENVTIAGNLADMYQNIWALGCDVEYQAGIMTPSVGIDALTIAGQ